jgi:glycine hydroxymethyltransferase
VSVLDLVARELPEVAEAIVRELEAQRGTLKLTASDNYASLPVLLAMGNWLSDKYA